MVEERWRERRWWLLGMAIATAFAVFVVQGDRSYGWLLGGLMGGAALMSLGRRRSQRHQEALQQLHTQRLAQWQTLTQTPFPLAPDRITPEAIAHLEQRWQDLRDQLHHQGAIGLQDSPWEEDPPGDLEQWDRQIAELQDLSHHLLTLYRHSYGDLQIRLGEWERLLSDRQEEIHHYQQQIHALQQLEQYALADNMRLQHHNRRLKKAHYYRKQGQHYWHRQAVDLQELITLYEDDIKQLKQEKEELHQTIIQAYQYGENLPCPSEMQAGRSSHPGEEESSNQPLYALVFGADALKCLSHLATHDSTRYRKVIKTVEKMRRDLRNNSLHTHPYDEKIGPQGERIFEAYVEHRTPGGWRLFWSYGPGDRCLTIHEITPHP